MENLKKKPLNSTKNQSEKPKSSMNGLETTSISMKPLEKPLRMGKHTLPNLKHLSEIYKDVQKDISVRGTVPKHQTGLIDLDEILWGLHKRELMIIGGKSSQGKSDFALNIIKNLVDEHRRIIYFSLEMSKEQLVERLLSNFCVIDNQLLRRGLAKEAISAKENSFIEWIDDIKLLIDDSCGYYFDTVLDVCNNIKPEFIVIDYIQMISIRGHKSKLEAIEDYVRRLKQYANENNVGIILLSQLNKEGDLKWAGVLREHPDTVLLLNWDWEKQEYIVTIDKQRHGEIGKIKLEYLPQYSLFKDWTVKIQKELL